MAAMIAIAGMLVVVASELSRVFASVHAPGGESASVEATPAAELLTRQFVNDHWGLINILRAADRRIGQRQLPALRRKTHNIAALKVLDARQKPAIPTGITPQQACAARPSRPPTSLPDA